MGDAVLINKVMHADAWLNLYLAFQIKNMFFCHWKKVIILNQYEHKQMKQWQSSVLSTFIKNYMMQSRKSKEAYTKALAVV